MPIGTLRDQLIYPDSVTEFYGKGGTDESLEELLIAVQMEHLLLRYSRRGFDTWYRLYLKHESLYLRV